MRTKIVRDIAESLGKLPPQAIDLEEAVIGALILESKKTHELLPVLNLHPFHFYKEQNKIVFEAIVSLVASNSQVDMRTVVFELRKRGHIEIVGGAGYIADLTGKVSSSSGIEGNAKIIIELAMKREMIQLASTIHNDAYEDTTDALELLDKTLKKFQKIHDNEITAPLAQQIKDQWSEIMVTEEPPAEEAFICIQGTNVATPGNHSLVIGKKKARKSLFITYAIGEFLKKFDGVAVFDTEQGKRHVWKYRDRVFRLTGKQVPFFSLNGKSPKERQIIIEQTLEYWPTKIRLIVIDGVRDLLTNINDENQCSELITWIQKLIIKYNIHIINVLHLNKTDNNARGHIGTELLNKAEATIELELDQKAGCTIVKCENSRERGFENFAFTHSHDDLPMLIDTPGQNGALQTDEQRSRIVTIFADGNLNYRALIDSLKIHLELAKTAAERKVAELVRNGTITKFGPERSKNTMYKLNIDATPGPTFRKLESAPRIETPPPPPEEADEPDWTKPSEDPEPKLPF